MRQLSEHDAVFLYSDTARVNANVTLLHIYDQSTASGGKVRFKSILSHVESRLPRLPILRQKLKRVPLDLDTPYWVEDEDFTLEYHVRHLALPKPGDWRQFCIQASRIHARPLDLSRPLWEAYVIEGLDSFLDLPPGSFALLLKLHHAAVDVEGGSEFTTLLHDTTSTPPRPEPVEPWFPEPPPGDLHLLGRALLHTALAPFRLARPFTRAVRTFVPSALSVLRELAKHPDDIVATRFNTEVSPHRVFETRRFPLEELAEVQRLVHGSTPGDVLLAAFAGGLRLYLQKEDELPERSLTAMVPLPTGQGPRADSWAGRLSWIRIVLGTDLEDPVSRLALIRRQTGSSRIRTRGSGERELTGMAQYAPAPTLAVTSKMLSYASAQIGRWVPLAGCTITDVPGPAVPLYLVGARMTYYSAIMPISDGMGLVGSVTTYDGKAVLSFTGCYEQLPDPEVLAQCVRDSFQEYLALARGKAEEAAD